jgi:hypothetical protein
MGIFFLRLFYLRWSFMTLAAITFATTEAESGEIPDHELAQMAVRDRPRAGYEPIGYRMGQHFFFPSLGAGFRYDSNIFASPANPQSDLAFVLSPGLTVTNAPRFGGPTPSAFTYQLDLNADLYRYRRFESEDRADAQAKLKTRWELAHDMTLEGNFLVARKHDERGDSALPPEAREPIPYTDLRAEGVFTKHFGRFGVELNANVRRLDYEDIFSVSGAPLSQNARNGSIFAAHIKPFYEFSPGYRGFVRFRGNTRDYEGIGILNRDSDGYDIRGGLEFAVTPLIKGSVEVGYLSQTYDNTLIAPFDGLSFAAKAQWLVTPLMTVTFNAERSVAETVTPDFEARLDTVYGVQIDYELMRNVILFSSVKLKQEEFRGVTARTDDVTQYSAGVEYLMNRHLSATLQYQFQDRDSNVPIYNFDRHVVNFGVKAKY